MPPKKAYKMPEALPKGEVFTDTQKKQWILGPSIGKGGFGEIYSAALGTSPPAKESDYCYVIKIEPFTNGPLFCEKNFYVRACKTDDVMSWMKKRNYKTFGMPLMHGCGSHECRGLKYRFLIMDRYSTDLWSLFISSNKVFPLSTVLQVSYQIVDVLEYIHSQGFIHADIKGANLLLGLKKGTENQVYVVDYGLAARFTTSDYKTDPRRAHNGTIEYTSRDAHSGVLTRRGDFEVLAYNIVHWLSSKLPWDAKLKDADAVQKAKESAMQNVPGFLKDCFGKKPVPDVVSKFIKYVSELQWNEAPDYSKVRKMFLDGLKMEGVKLDAPLCFTKSAEPQNGISKAKKGRSSPRKVSSSNAGSSKANSKEKKNNYSDDSIEEETSASKKRKAIVKPDESGEDELTVKKSKGVSSKGKSKPKDDKPSWRDCLTAQASGVVKAGEYVSRNSKAKEIKSDIPLEKTLKEQNGVTVTKKGLSNAGKSSQVSNAKSLLANDEKSYENIFLVSDEEEESPKPRKRKVKTVPVHHDESNEISDSESDYDSDYQESVKKRGKSVQSKSKSKPKEDKPSWRDCPTAKASRVVRAGEYVSQNSKKKTNK